MFRNLANAPFVIASSAADDNTERPHSALRRTGGVKAAPQGRPQRSKLDVVSDWLKTRVEAEPDITMPELAEVLKQEHAVTATPAMLSRHLIHQLGFTY